MVAQSVLQFAVVTAIAWQKSRVNAAAQHHAWQNRQTSLGLL